MDIFDRLGNLIRTIIDDPDDDSNGAGDPDLAVAWEELENYIREGTPSNTGGRAAADGTRTRADGSRTASGPAEQLRAEQLGRDFRNLEVPVGAPIESVRQNYKRLMAAFHPDRHSADPEKLRTATEVTKRLNESYTRIRDYYEGRA